MTLPTIFGSSVWIHAAMAVRGDDGDYSLHQLADDVLAVMDRLRHSPRAFRGLVAWRHDRADSGCKVAAGRFESLTLCATFATHLGRCGQTGLTPCAPSGVAPLVDGTMERWFTPAFWGTAPRPSTAVATDDRRHLSQWLCRLCRRDPRYEPDRRPRADPTAHSAYRGGPGPLCHARSHAGSARPDSGCANMWKSPMRRISSPLEKPAEAAALIHGFLQRNMASSV